MAIDLTRRPASDLGLKQKSAIEQHLEKIRQQEYSAATASLDANGVNNSGIRATMINSIRRNILEIEAYLLNLTAEPDTYFSVEEPTSEEMGNKIFWVKVGNIDED